MTVEELESLAESKDDKPTIRLQKEKEKSGSDPLKSILTAAIHKHTKKKNTKEVVKSSKEDSIEEKPQAVGNSNDLEERSEEPRSETVSKKDISSGRKHKKDTALKSDQRVLGITLHCCERLEASPVVFPHPVVQVHICDAESGRWLQKSAKDRKVTSYYEGSDVDYILPIMTQPFDMKKNKSLCCQWQEQLIFNESKEHFTTEDPPVIIFFQLMDFPSSSNISGISYNQSQNASSVGWVTLAWAFLKVKGNNSHVNIGQKLRLQLWRPRKSTNVSMTDVYSWWKSGSRSKYSSTLSVSLQEIRIPQNPQPALRSMLVTQREYGGDLGPDNFIGDLSRRESNSNHSVNAHVSSIQWGRKPNQSCKIPNQVKYCLQHVDEGCMVVKFSHNGLRLACGAHKQILIYEVLSGKLEYIFSGHLGLVYDICWSDNDHMILSASGDSTARVWNVESGSDHCGSSQTLTHPSHVYTSRFVPSKPQVFVSGGYDHVLRVWFTDAHGTYVMIQEQTNHLAFVNSLCFNDEGDILYSGDKQGVILVWNVKVPKKAHSKRRTTILSLQHEVKITDIMGKVVNSISYHPGGYRLLIQTRDSQLRLVNHKQWTVTHRLTGLLNVREQLHGCVSPCGTWVLSGSEDYGIYVWHSDTGELLAAFHNLPIKGTISCVDFHPFDNMVAVCSYASQTPVLVLTHNPEKLPISNTILTSIKPDNSASLAGSLIRGYNGSEVSEVHDKNLQNKHLSVGSSTKVPQNHQEPKPIVPFVNLNASNIMYIDETNAENPKTIDGKEMWHDVGRKILYDLDNILKLASENPLSIDNSNVNDERHVLKPIGKLATVIYDYEASEPDELSVKQGDYVMIVKSENSDWWQVRTADMKSTGFVPANYLKHLPHEQHPQYDNERIIAVHSGSGEVSFISDVEGTPSKARARRHKAKKSSSQNMTSMSKNK